MKYCTKKQRSVWEHFRGFEATIQSATGTFVQTYGTLDTSSSDNKCEEFDIDEEIMYIEIYSDTNDIEGLVIYGDKGAVWTMRANGDREINKFRMGGRPLGFGIYMG